MPFRIQEVDMKSRELTRCTKCVLPITWETVFFDNKGVCNICKNWVEKQKTIDWQAREKELLKIFKEAKAKNNQYDCI